MNRSILAHAAVALATVSGAARAQTILYVDGGMPIVGTHNGLAWGTAYLDIQQALAYARTHPSVQQIRVAEGTYTPGASVTSTFDLVDGVTLRGGYSGHPAAGAGPSPSLYPTVLSGDVAAGVRAYHVVTCAVQGAVLVENVTIRRGLAGGVADRLGGGVYAPSGWFRLANSIVEENIAASHGGGIYLGSEAELWLYNSVVRDNMAAVGGGLAVISTNPDNRVFRATLEDNQANAGGAIYIDEALTVASSVIARNSATGAGGGVFADNADQSVGVEMLNVTFTQNSAGTAGGGFWGDPAVLAHALRNSILWANTAPSAPQAGGDTVLVYCDVQGLATVGLPSMASIDVDPMFVGATDYRLKSTSPCLERGSNSWVPSWGQYDRLGRDRIQSSNVWPAPASPLIVDIGAYEHTDIVPQPATFARTFSLPDPPEALGNFVKAFSRGEAAADLAEPWGVLDAADFAAALRAAVDSR